MKFSTASVAGLLALCASSTTAFAPTATTQQSTALHAQRNDKKNVNQALSFVAAASLAVATSVAMPTVDFVDSSFTQQQQQQIAVAPTVHVAGIPAANAFGEKKTPAAAPKLSKEESERNSSKKNLELAQASLKEYQKYVSDLTAAYKKAGNTATSTQKQATDAKNAFMKANDKLSKAKSQKMPSSAIQELQSSVCEYILIICLSVPDREIYVVVSHFLLSLGSFLVLYSIDTAKSKETLKVKESAESEAAKFTNKLEKDLKSAQKAVKDSEGAIKKAKKRAQQADKNYQQYLKKQQKLAKEKAKREAEKKKKFDKQVKAEREKVKALEKANSKLQSAKRKDADSLKATQKQLEVELKNLEKLKAKGGNK